MELALGPVVAFVGNVFEANALTQYYASQLVENNASEIAAPCKAEIVEGEL